MSLTDAQINAYIDGRLSQKDRAAVAAILLADPDLMHKVMRMVLINDVVRGLGQHVLQEPLPDTIQQVLDTKKPREP
ncbi:anti-sigma factor [Methyloceanibacter sp. wino2]|uniref:anti-sigma factor family protein n=1 Tax=Methyloceanibacter sp. wino2 TaxID=2170729 RepID=UPI000D3E43E9|nr:hypothetical protein [Methyloceanibacter sp. wino2]